MRTYNWVFIHGALMVTVRIRKEEMIKPSLYCSKRQTEGPLRLQNSSYVMV